MRFTKKLNPPYEKVAGEDYVYTSDTRLTPSFAKVEQKLGQLEDIEEELGIDLIALFKVLKQGYVFVREHNTKEKEIVYERVKLNYPNQTLDFIEPRKEIGKGRNLIEYGKTWALKKEELL